MEFLISIKRNNKILFIFYIGHDFNLNLFLATKHVTILIYLVQNKGYS